MSSKSMLLALLAVAALSASMTMGRAPGAPPEGESLNTDSHLVGWWKLDEASGTQAADASGHGHAGVLGGGLSFDHASAPGRLGKALRFDRGNDAVRIAGYKGITGTGARTVAAWIRTARPQGEIVSWGKPDFGKMWIFGFIRGHVGVTPKGGYYYMEPTVHDNAWHHVAVVLRAGEPPTLYRHATVYLDGKIAEPDRIGLLDLWPINTEQDQDVTLGRGFRGLLDDVRIYDRALSDEEVEALYRMGK